MQMKINNLISACFQNQKMNTFRVNTVYKCSSFYENILAVSFVGSALGTDKKINLAVGIYVIVDAAKTARSSAQRRPVNVRGDGLHLVHGYSLARFGRPIWTVELGLHPLASLVSSRTLDEVAGGAGPQRPRQAAFSGCQSCQSASRCEQPRRRPAKSGHWTHQGRFQHQDQCLGATSLHRRDEEISARRSPRLRASMWSEGQAE